MVVVDVVNPDNNEKHTFYIDGKLKTELDKIRKRITHKDSDYVLVVDGEEGSGKSVLAQQMCKYVDPTFNLNRVYFDSQSFYEGVVNCNMKTAHQFDEAFTGLSSRTSLSEINHLLNSMIMQMRQKNLFVCIVLPSIFILDKYPAMFRSRALIHTYVKHGARGRFIVFNRKKKNQLVLKGKRDYSYNVVRSQFRGRFTDKYTIPEDEYRKKKLKAMNIQKGTPRSEKITRERDMIGRLHFKEMGLSLRGFEKYLKENGVNLSSTTIGRMLPETPTRPQNAPASENKL